MKRILLSFLLIVLLLVGIAPAVAQEVTETPAATEEFATNTPAPTEAATVAPEPTIAPTRPAPVDLEPIAGVEAYNIWPIIAGIALVLLGMFEAIRGRQVSQLIDRYAEALNRRDFQDLGEREYIRTSIAVKDAITLFRSVLVVAGNLNLPGIDVAIDETVEYIDTVSDGKPNDPPPV